MATEHPTVCILLMLMLCGTCGCLSPRGLVFTCVTVPYALPEADLTATGSKTCRIDITQIKEPLSRAGLSVMWSNRAVTEAMTRSGMKEIRYADLQTLSILNGIYLRRRLLLYGD